MKILLATDFSPAAAFAEEVLRHLLPHAKGSVIRVVTVIDRYTAYETADAEVVDVQHDIVDMTESRLDALTRALRGAGATVEEEMLIGDAASRIVSDAAAAHVDLVVVGGRLRGPLAVALLGSVSASLVDHAHCPVLIARTTTVDKVLVADDGSTGAHVAAEYLQSSGIFQGAEAEVLTVAEAFTMPLGYDTEVPVMSAEALRTYDEIIDDAHRRAEQQAEATKEALDASGFHTTMNVREGNVAAEIVAEADATGADLIVMGSREHAGLSRLALGSVVRGVLTHAHCSVLVVPPNAPGVHASA